MQSWGVNSRKVARCEVNNVTAWLHWKHFRRRPFNLFNFFDFFILRNFVTNQGCLYKISLFRRLCLIIFISIFQYKLVFCCIITHLSLSSFFLKILSLFKTHCCIQILNGKSDRRSVKIQPLGLVFKFCEVDLVIPLFLYLNFFCINNSCNQLRLSLTQAWICRLGYEVVDFAFSIFTSILFIITCISQSGMGLFALSLLKKKYFIGIYSENLKGNLPNI